MSIAPVYLFLGPESGDKNREIAALRRELGGGAGNGPGAGNGSSAGNGPGAGTGSSAGNGPGAGNGSSAGNGPGAGTGSSAGNGPGAGTGSSAATAPSPQIDEHTLHGFEDDVASLVRLLRSPSLFSDGQFVVMRSVELLRGADQAAQLADYLKNPSAHSVLVLESSESSISKIPVLQKNGSLIPKKQQRVFWEMFEDRRLPWLNNFVQGRGGRISRDAAELFLETVENNTETMAWELEKLLAMHSDTTSISVEEVEAYLFHSKAESPFTIFDYLGDRNLEACVAAIPGLVQIEGTGIPLMAGLLRQFRTLARIKSMQPRGVPSTALLEEVGVKFKRAQKSMAAFASHFSAAETAAALRVALQYEFALREFGVGMHVHLLQLFSYQVIVRGGQGSIVSKAPGMDYSGLFSLLRV